jgi:hypothetical protein
MKIDEIRETLNSQEYFLCLHNGFHPFSYGCPYNPIVFNNTEGEMLLNILNNKYGMNILFDISLANLLTIKLDKNIGEKIGFRLIGVYEKQTILFEDKNEEEKSKNIKNSILENYISE